MRCGFVATRAVGSLPLKGGGSGWGSALALFRGLALLLFCLTSTAVAQQAAAPEPILRVKVDPPSIVVGQSAVLQIDVLAPNYMTRPPVMPDFQLRNAVTRAGSTINMSEQRDGVTYAGVRFEFLIYPQEPGGYAVSGQKVSITYAAEPPATRMVELSVPRIAFEAIIPDAAQSLDPFVSATKLTVRQQVQRSSEQLKVGDAVTRTVTIEAEGTPSMLLPPTAFAAIDGTRLYPAQPELQDRVDRRTDRLSSTRIDQATYMLERPGDLSMPGIEVAWWNVQENRIERARAEPAVLQVADNPTLKPGADSRSGVSPPSFRSMLAFVVDHWLSTLLILAALAVLAWVMPAAVRTLLAWNRRRRAEYQASERHAFANLEAAARAGDARRSYFALLDWLQRFEAAGPTHTIGAFKAAARAPELDREIANIEQYLFGRDQGESPWTSYDFSKQIAQVRHRLLRSASVDEPVLPANLNPRAALPSPA